MQLNVTNITYAGENIWNDDGLGAVLSSTESSLILVPEYAQDLFTAWAEEMKKISGVSCTLTGSG